MNKPKEDIGTSETVVGWTEDPVGADRQENVNSAWGGGKGLACLWVGAHVYMSVETCIFWNQEEKEWASILDSLYCFEGGELSEGLEWCLHLNPTNWIVQYAAALML